MLSKLRWDQSEFNFKGPTPLPVKTGHGSQNVLRRVNCKLRLFCVYWTGSEVVVESVEVFGRPEGTNFGFPRFVPVSFQSSVFLLLLLLIGIEGGPTVVSI